MKKNKAPFVVVIGMLAAQGCTVNVNPAVGVPGGHTHQAVIVPHAVTQGTDRDSPEETTQGAEGETGIRGPKQPTGSQGSAGQVMGRNATVVSPVAPGVPPQLPAQKPEDDTAFGKKFWASVIAQSVMPVVVPAVVGALFNQ